MSLAEEAIFKNLLLNVLRSTPTQRINFYFGIAHISGPQYRYIADLLEKGDIGVKFGQVPAGAAAAYYARP
jgi:hypothetical protein